MGYFKNELIAGQVEVGDRIPAPKPATSHVAFPERRLRRQMEQRVRRSVRADLRAVTLNSLMMFVLGGITVGSVWFVLEVL